ncbi:NlpC/P60 family protein [Sulfurovum sp.]|uniref:C40 family peptidase n=1 Tax=Sulfurovum sp. TaxID=1969726 RepID=UPI00286815D7|nr:NlpC/P60 family protein [Sulfurovum sp.]
MKKIYALLFTLSMTTVSVQAAIKHKVKSGETLTLIAKKHHTSINKVRKANGMKKGEILKSGKVLTIPSKSSYTLYNKYSIKKGDTLTALARKHQTSVGKLRKVNGISRNETLIIGKTLKVPSTKTSYKVAKKTKKSSNKNLASSIANLDTINLKTQKVVKKKESFVLSDIFSSVDKNELSKCTRLTTDAKKKLGKKYVWGASGRGNTYDCSSFTKYVYRKNGMTIPRTSIMQSKHGKYVKRKDLQVGDLIFFDTSKKRKGYVNHVGIYLGDNKFIHASSAKKKVVVSNLSKFYGQRYKGARRPS